MSRALPIAAAVGLPALLAFLACHVPSEPESGMPDVLVDAGAHGRESAAELYARHCAVCHGPEGRGDGEASPYLFPPARRFDRARFRLVSSANGAPFDRDLVATLRRGIPGSAMPGWGWLAEEDLWALAAHVRALAVDGLEQDLVAEARSADDPLLAAEAARIARARMTPDRALEPAPLARVDEPTLARGEAVYRQHCLQCHGPEGRGEPEPRVDEDGTPNWARDFTRGWLKGGDSPRELACRIRAGMPGTAMPPTELAPPDEAALIVYVRSLIEEGSADRLVHRRESLRARHVADTPAAPDDPAWESAEELSVTLAPLWWNPDSVHAARLAALHDGEDLALRLSWADASGEVRLFSDTTTSDAAALQLSDAPRPALFGMGAPGAPTNLWHWQAVRLQDIAGALDLVEPVPHARTPELPRDARPDVPLYRRLVLEPSERVDRITVAGVESIAAATRVAGEVRAVARWHDGRWSVVFRRPLRPADGGELELVPERPVQVACAVWNGAAGDEGARKSISIWQELVLER